MNSNDVGHLDVARDELQKPLEEDELRDGIIVVDAYQQGLTNAIKFQGLGNRLKTQLNHHPDLISAANMFKDQQWTFRRVRLAWWVDHLEILNMASSIQSFDSEKQSV
jgi:hypothetical protein